MYWKDIWSFIGLFSSVHWSKVEYCVLRCPFSQSLNQEDVLSLFSVVGFLNSSPTIPMCNHTVYLNSFSINWLKPLVCLPLYRLDIWINVIYVGM